MWAVTSGIQAHTASFSQLSRGPSRFSVSAPRQRRFDEIWVPRWILRQSSRRHSRVASIEPPRQLFCAMYSLSSGIPMCVMADSYKAAHFEQYPDATRMVAYGEFRTGLEHDAEDTRIALFGVRFIVEKILSRQWTLQELHNAEKFYSSHKAPGYTQFPFPRELFRKFITENDETLMTMIWYPSTVATLSKRVRDTIERFFKETTDLELQSPLIESRLHDFGFRGCTTVDQGVLGGCAHLLNFTGTDTMPAAYYAQFSMNDGEPIGSSIPATEHSVMTAWDSEKSAILNMIDHYGTGLFACVMDSYDYAHALEKLLPAISTQKLEKGGFMVLRPDSGDPAEAVLQVGPIEHHRASRCEQALDAADAVFGSDLNSKGYRVLRGCGVIQGDAMTSHKICYVLEKMKDAGYSAENCAFGMGGGLLQKINRDTMSFATKLSHITYADGSIRDVMKTPKTDTGKFSLPGELAVKRVSGIPTVFPADQVTPEDNLLQVYYDRRPMPDLKWEKFSDMRQRVKSEWAALPRYYDPISAPLAAKISDFMQR